MVCRPSRSLCAVILFVSLTSGALARTITIDGDPSDWTGTPDSTLHAVTISQDEWIYRGESGDVRNDPSAVSRPNYDITEVRLASDNDYLYLLVRFADVLNTNEVSVCVGVDTDRSASDSNGLSFFGDESGLTFSAGPEKSPEHLIQFHNAQNGITWPEYYHDAGTSFWYTSLDGL